MTPEQKEKYLQYSGGLCPYCNSEDITAGESNADGDTISVSVSCNGCNKEWTDIYTLTDVEDRP